MAAISEYFRPFEEQNQPPKFKVAANLSQDDNRLLGTPHPYLYALTIRYENIKFYISTIYQKSWKIRKNLICWVKLSMKNIEELQRQSYMPTKGLKK